MSERNRVTKGLKTEKIVLKELSKQLDKKSLKRTQSRLKMFTADITTIEKEITELILKDNKVAPRPRGAVEERSAPRPRRRKQNSPKTACIVGNLNFRQNSPRESARGSQPSRTPSPEGV